MFPVIAVHSGTSPPPMTRPYFRLSLHLVAGNTDSVISRVRAATGRDLRLLFVHRRSDRAVFGIQAPHHARAEMARLVRRLNQHPGVVAVRWEVVPTTADAFAPFA